MTDTNAGIPLTSVQQSIRNGTFGVRSATDEERAAIGVASPDTNAGTVLPLLGADCLVFSATQTRAYGLQCWTACDKQVAGPLRERIAELEQMLDSEQRRPHHGTWVAMLAECQALRSERDRLRAENEALRALLREVSCVAITMLYDTHKADVLALFTIPELEEVTASTQHLQSQSVESVYRRGFDAARAAREGA